MDEKISVDVYVVYSAMIVNKGYDSDPDYYLPLYLSFKDAEDEHPGCDIEHMMILVDADKIQ